MSATGTSPQRSVRNERALSPPSGSFPSLEVIAATTGVNSDCNDQVPSNHLVYRTLCTVLHERDLITLLLKCRRVFRETVYRLAVAAVAMLTVYPPSLWLVRGKFHGYIPCDLQNPQA